MRIRRRLPPLRQWSLPAWARPEALRQRRTQLWVAAVLGAILAGYLTASLVLFPAPILPGRQEVPRVLGLPAVEARTMIADAGLRAAGDSSESHPVAAAGTIIWQDPPPGVRASQGARVVLVASAGPPRVPVPDVAGYDAGLARTVMRAAGLAVSRTEFVTAPAPRGVTVVTRPTAGSMVPGGSGVVLVVSQGAATVAVPDVLGMSAPDARSALERDGLQLGTVARRRTHDATPGTVVAQRPASGTLAAPGTVIDIWIARSP